MPKACAWWQRLALRAARGRCRVPSLPFLVALLLSRRDCVSKLETEPFQRGVSYVQPLPKRHLPFEKYKVSLCS